MRPLRGPTRRRSASGTRRDEVRALIESL
jgi:hypothetical protein